MLHDHIAPRPHGSHQSLIMSQRKHEQLLIEIPAAGQANMEHGEEGGHQVGPARHH